MTKYERDRLKIWVVVVRSKGNTTWCATSIRWFHTRKECRAYIRQFRNEQPGVYEGMEHKPMMFLPRGVK